MNCLVSWSSGKDSAWMLHVLRQQGVHVCGLLTTINDAAQRVAMHGVRLDVLRAQAAAAGVPLITVPLPWACSNDDYERIMAGVVERVACDGATHIAFADLFLEDIRQYREKRLEGSGLTPIFPLFGADTSTLAREMIAGGLRARIATVDPRALDRRFAGREFDASLLADVPQEVDPCGERGEFHTVAYAGPMFSEPLAIEMGTTIERDGFVFTDFTLTGRSEATNAREGEGAE